MKILWVALLAVLLVSCNTEPDNYVSSDEQLPRTEYQSPTIAPARPAATNTVVKGPLPECLKTVNYEVAELVEVIDGDTIEVNLNGTIERVRYLGIDAPELTASDPQPGLDAKEVNRTLVEEKTLWLVRGDTERDEFGRLLRYVLADEAFVNILLISKGQATTFAVSNDPYCANEFKQVMQDAYRNNRGIWAAINAQYKVQVDEICPEGCKSHEKNCDIKGNISQNGDRIFHLPGTKNYESVSISPSKGERWFCSVGEAIQNNFRPPRAE